MKPSRGRRDVLRAVAAGGLAASLPLAGCSQLPTGSGGENERPAYHAYVPAESSGSAETEGTSFVALDAERLRELESQDLQGQLPEDATVGFDDGGQTDADPVLAYPGSGLFVAVLAMSFGLVPYGFATDVMGGIGAQFGSETPNDGAQTPDEGPHRVDAAVMLDSTIVFEGSFDVGAIVDADQGFERAGERGGFEVYEGVANGSGISTEGLAFAVEESRLVVLIGSDLDEPRARLDRAIDAAAGDVERLSADADADWALRTAGHGLVTIGGWGVDPVQAGGESGQSGGVDVDTVLRDAEGIVSSLAVEGEQARGAVAAVFPEGETPDRERIEADLGGSATDRDVTVDGTRVAVTATYELAADADGPEATPTSTPTPVRAYETRVDEQVTADTTYWYDLEEGDRVRLTVEHQRGGNTLIYAGRRQGGSGILNDATSERETWEFRAEVADEYYVDVYPDERAAVTIEVATA